jgi:hypothetical protein
VVTLPKLNAYFYRSDFYNKLYMRRIPLLIFSTLIAISSYSQNIDLTFAFKNSGQLEFGGHGLLYSFNYERILINNPEYKTTGQIGFSYYPPKSGIKDIWIPVLINELLSFNKQHFEFGLGYVFTNEALRSANNKVVSREWNGFVAGRLGYRYQKPNGRLLIRIGFTPLVEDIDSSNPEIHPLGGVSLGYCF